MAIATIARPSRPENGHNQGQDREGVLIKNGEYIACQKSEIFQSEIST